MTTAETESRRILIPRDLPPEALRGAGSGLPVCALEGKTMGTYWSARLQLPRGLTPEWAEAALTSSFDLVIRQMSHWDESSDLCRFNRAAPDTWHELPPEFFHVLTRAIEIARESGGLLDPTLGEVVDLHGHGPSRTPDTTRVPQALRRTGWGRLVLDPANRAAFQPGGLALDLSSIAKGYAVDLAAERLGALGVEHFLIEIGGELRGRGCKPDGDPWWVSLARPSDSLPETLAALCGLSVATSGDVFRRHLIDPRTGTPASGELAAVTVFHRDCMDADAWATALFIAGEDRGLELAEAQGLPALFTVRTPDGPAERWTTPLATMEE